MAGGASRIFGLGITVSAKDDGAKRTVHDLREETDGLASAAMEAGRNTAGLGMSWDSFVQGLQLHRLNQITSVLQSMAAQAGQLPGIMGAEAFQSTGIESHAAQFSNTWRNMEARLGNAANIIAPARRELASLSYNLEVSADQMVAVLGPLARVGHSLEDFGLTNRALAGHLRAGTIEGEAFGQFLVSLSDGFGLGTERAGRLADQIMAVGVAVGDVGGAMNVGTSMMETMNAAMAEFPDMADRVDEYALSAVQLAGAMQQAGLGSMAQVQQDAAAIFSALAGSRRNLTNLFTGLGSDFDSLATELAVAGGDVNVAVENLMQDPARFAEVMAGALEDASDPVRAQRLRSTLAGISPNLAFMTANAEGTASALRAMAEASGNAEGTFNRVGEAAAHVSRTLAESMERQQDAFTTRLNRLSREAVGGSGNILRVQRETYNRIMSGIEEHAGESGPLGMLTRGFLRSRTGIFAFTGALEAMGGPVLDTLANLAPLVSSVMSLGSPLVSMAGTVNSMLGGLPGRIVGVLGPVGLLAGAGTLLYRNWDTVEEVFGAAWVKIQQFAARLPGIAMQFSEWVSGIDWEALGNDIVQGLIDVFEGASGEVSENASAARRVAGNIGQFFVTVFKAIPKIVIGLAKGMWDRTVEYIAEPPDLAGKLRRGAGVLASVFGAALFTPLRGLLMGGIGSAFSGLFSGLGGFLTGGQALGMGAVRTMVRRIPVIGGIIGVLFELPNIIEDLGNEDYSGAARRLFTSVADGLLLGIPSLLDSLLGTDVFGDALEFLFESTNFGRVTEAIENGNLGDAIFEGLFTAVNVAMFGIPGLIRTAFEEMGLGDIFGGLMDAVSPIFEDIYTFWRDTIVSMYDSAVETFNYISDYVGGFVDTISPFFVRMGGVFSRILGQMQRVFSRVMEFIAPVAERVFTFIGSILSFVWENVMKPVFEGIKYAFGVVADFIKESFGAVVSFFAVGIATMAENFSAGIDILEMRWDAMKDFVTLGARIIGLSIRNFFMNPIMRAQNTISNLAEAFESAFGRIGIMMLNAKAAIIDFLVSAARNIPGVEELFGDSIASMSRSADEARREAERRETLLEERRREREQERLERLAQIQNNERELAETREQLTSRAARLWEDEQARRAEAARNIEAAAQEILAADRAGREAAQEGERRRAREEAERQTAPTAPVVPEMQAMPVAENVAPASEARRMRVARQQSREPSPREQREQAQHIMQRRRELQEEARRVQAEETGDAQPAAIQSFGPTAIAQLADALTIRIPRQAPAGSVVGS